MGILSLILIIISLSLPWYHTIFRDGPDSNNIVRTYESKYYFTGSIANYPEAGNHNFQPWGDVPRSDSTAQLFSYFQMLDNIGILLVAIFIAGMLAALLKGRREIAVFLGLIAAIFCLFVPLFFMQEYPSAVNADGQQGSDALPFWYVEDNPDLEIGVPGNVHHRITTWAPDTGWYLPIISALLCVSAVTLISVERPRPSWRKYVTPLIAALIIVVILIPSVMAYYTRPHYTGGDLVEAFGLQIQISTNDDWQINITGNAGPASALILDLANTSTGESHLHASVSSGTADNVNFTWLDANSNKKLDSGDNIILKGTINGQPNPSVQAGFKVQLLYKNNIVGNSPVLPSH